MEFAVIQTGGKQYKVAPGDSLNIEKLPGDFKKGDEITFNDVLLVDTGSNTKIGTPFVAGAKVMATFEENARAQTVTVIKFKQKSRYFKKNGHRQPYTKVTITKVS